MTREDKRRAAWWLIVGEIVAVAVLLLLYLRVKGIPPVEGVGLGPVLGAGIGASLAYLLTRRQLREEEQRRRRALATILLSEAQLLYSILKDIDQAYWMKAIHGEAIEAFHTAMYDQAGADRILFQPETVHALAHLYQLVHTLRTELNRFRRGSSFAAFGIPRPRYIQAPHRLQARRLHPPPDYPLAINRFAWRHQGPISDRGTCNPSSPAGATNSRSPLCLNPQTVRLHRTSAY